MGGDRAQTSIDFAIAMAVFLVALTTVVAFMPTMTQPFTGGQQNPLLADRLTAQLVDGQLGEPSNPSHLDEGCTWEFFGTGSNDCETFDESQGLNERLGVPDRVQVNVTLRNASAGSTLELLCGVPDGTGDELGAVMNPDDASCSGGDEILLAAGPNPPTESGSVTIGRRYAVVTGDPVYVVVRVWT